MNIAAEQVPGVYRRRLGDFLVHECHNPRGGRVMLQLLWIRR